MHAAICPDLPGGGASFISVVRSAKHANDDVRLAGSQVSAKLVPPAEDQVREMPAFKPKQTICLLIRNERS